MHCDRTLDHPPFPAEEGVVSSPYTKNGLRSVSGANTMWYTGEKMGRRNTLGEAREVSSKGTSTIILPRITGHGGGSHFRLCLFNLLTP